jgi:hypothetical protein
LSAEVAEVAEIAEGVRALVARQVLLPEQCRAIIPHAEGLPNMVWDGRLLWTGSRGDIPGSLAASCGKGDIDATVLEPARACLLGLLPRLQEYFRIRLSAIQELRVQSYGPGDYFGAHFDNNGDPRAPLAAFRRRLSAVLFLNSGGGDGEFGGGTLRLCPETSATRAADQACVDVAPRAGMLVVFSAGLLHEVTPVTWGSRFTVLAHYV